MSGGWLRSILVAAWVFVGLCLSFVAWWSNRGWSGVERATWVAALWGAPTVAAIGIVWARRHSGPSPDLPREPVNGPHRADDVQLDRHHESAPGTGSPGADDQLKPHASPPPRRSAKSFTIDDIMSDDPVLGVAAARHFHENGDAHIVAELALCQPTKMHSMRLVRYAISGKPDVSGKLLVGKIADADADNDGWLQASAAVQKLTTAHLPYTANDLATIVRKGGTDSTRLAIEGLGHIAATGWVSLINDTATNNGKYYFDKFAPYAITAFARMFQYSDTAAEYEVSGKLQRSATSTFLREFIVDHGDRIPPLSMHDLYTEFQRLRPWHADTLLGEWLDSDNHLVVSLAATGLGHMRLARARQRLADAADRIGGDTAAGLLREIGRIGGTEAVALLRKRQDREAGRDALAMCVDAALDEEFPDLVEELLARARPSMRWWVYRAFGRRAAGAAAAAGADKTALSHLERGLHDADSVVRGVSALALARIAPNAYAQAVTAAAAEASESLERALATLGRLHMSGDVSIVDSLKTPLAHRAWEYEPVLFDDVIEILEDRGGAPGTELGEALHWIRTAQ